MKTLFLLRHAKSSWDSPDQRDFDRPLNPRGKAAAALMGQHIAATGLVPEIVYCSPAVRTRETSARLALAGRWPEAVIADDIYMASAETLMALVRAAPASARSMAIIGHNPGLEDLALLLAAHGAPDLRAELDAKFPTATLCEIELDIAHWSEVAAKCGTLLGFTAPRHLGQPADDED